MRDVWFAVRFLLSTSWRTDRRRLTIGGSLVVLGMLTTPVIGLALREAVNALVAGDRTWAAGSAAVTAVALVGELMLGHFAHLFYFELGEINELELNRALLRAVNGSVDLEQFEDPGFVAQLELVRQDLAKMRQTVQFCLQLLGLALQLVITTLIVGLLSPWLLLLLPAALVPVLMSKRAQQEVEQGRERSAGTARAITSLRGVLISARAQPEIRLSRSSTFLRDREAGLQREVREVLAAAEGRQGLILAAGQSVFAVAYVTAVALVFHLALTGRANTGDVVLVIVLATQIGQQVTTGLSLLSSLFSSAIGLRRFTGFETAAGAVAAADAPGEEIGHLTEGIRLEDLSFAYPGSDQRALDRINLVVPAGTSLAVVGENGAGKSTLLKLLVGLHRPTGGRILVDGRQLRPADVTEWRRNTATMFQDFANLELTLQHSVGLGHLPDVDDPDAVRSAIGRAGAGALLERLGDDPSTLLGRGYGDGVELSGGQWQSVGFARVLMRRTPLLLSLDEPGHSLDALSEERMYDAYRSQADAISAQVGGVTVFVTHRLSTVRMADRVVVLKGGRVAESGTHEQLLADGGHYAQLYAMQAQKYD